MTHFLAGEIDHILACRRVLPGGSARHKDPRQLGFQLSSCFSQIGSNVPLCQVRIFVEGKMFRGTTQIATSEFVLADMAQMDAMK